MLPTNYQQFIHTSRYARWSDEDGRRESWPETVGRYFDFFEDHLKTKCDFQVPMCELLEARHAVESLMVMPSMRCLMTAGPALARDHVAAYNCAYTPIDNLRAFDETLFILMCATGVGFSVERQYVSQLPVVPAALSDSNEVIEVRDSKRGWAEALRKLIATLYEGRIPKWDTRKVRGPGERLKTMGGRASGPAPLIELFQYVVKMLQGAVGRKRTSIECHDIVCKIGECVVVGGVRRSALISLSNLSDHRMRDAKAGEWWVLEPQRKLSNNSVAYTETPEVGQFMAEWQALYASKSGERGIFNREAAWKQAMSSGRRNGFYSDGALINPPFPGRTKIDFGCNPCCEIILRPKEFCNLSTIVVRAEDTMETLHEKARIATILGTWQSTVTDFRYLTKKWSDNCKEERLLGVSMTGIMSNPLLYEMDGLAGRLEELLETCIGTNEELAPRIGIPVSAAITCVKPEGTASQMVAAASGIHAAYAEFYIRRVRQDVKDPLTTMLIDQGVPYEVDIMNSENIVFEFPQRSDEGSVLRNDMTAIQQLEHWKVFQNHWCEHKPSITVYVREKEWPSVGGWVYDNFDDKSGVSFLPHSDHTYKQAPYEEIDEEAYNQRVADMPEIIWSQLGRYEREDNTSSSHELACTAGGCEI